MNTLIIPLSVLCGVVLAATAVSLAAAYRAHRVFAEIEARAERLKDQKEEDLKPLRESVTSLSSQVHDLQSHPQAAQPAAVSLPRSGFNLSKRSQALRMHRRGEAAEQIAASLEVPRQEIELLLKVHRIVIQNV
jgi:hypothetical protein